MILVAVILMDLAAVGLAWWGSAIVWKRDYASVPAEAPAVVFYSSHDADRQARIAATLDLLRRGGPRAVLIVGGARPGRGYFGAEEMATELIALGVPATSIRTERSSYDTESNTEAAISLLSVAPAAVLVSDPLHFPRILVGLRRRGWDRPVAFHHSSRQDQSLATALLRTHYEAIAWLGLLAPQAVRDAVFRFIRR